MGTLSALSLEDQQRQRTLSVNLWYPSDGERGERGERGESPATPPIRSASPDYTESWAGWFSGSLGLPGPPSGQSRISGDYTTTSQNNVYPNAHAPKYLFTLHGGTHAGYGEQEVEEHPDSFCAGVKEFFANSDSFTNVSYFDQLMEREPDTGITAFLMSVFDESAGNRQQAVEYLSEHLSSDSDDVEMMSE